MKTDLVRASDARVNAKVEKTDFPVETNDDFQRLRQVWTTLPRTPKLTAGPEEAEIILKGGNQVIREMLAGEDSAGGLQVCYVTLEPGPGAGDHHQPLEDELWFCVEGDWEWTVGEKTIRASKGAFAYIPRNTTHRFRNVGTTTAVMFTLNTPAGHERGFRSVSENAGKPGVNVREILAAHDMIMHP